MTNPDDTVTIEHYGKKYTARYTVDAKCVTIHFKDEEGNYIKDTIQSGNSPAEAVARMLLRKMVIRKLQ